jgi:hypothetical protein
MASAAGDIFDEYHGDALAIAEQLVHVLSVNQQYWDALHEFAAREPKLNRELAEAENVRDRALMKHAEQYAEIAKLRARDEAATAAIERVGINWDNPIGPPALTLSARSIVDSQWPGLPDDLDALARAHEERTDR